MLAADLRLVMMGTGTFAEPALRALLAARYNVVGLVTQPDRPAGSQRGSTRQTGAGMKSIALEKGIPVLQPQSINSAEGIAAVQALRPDLLVVAAYGQILARDVLASAARGGINIHGSLLPKYRGAAPVAWAIYHGETRTGVTIIRMSVSLDAGDMLAQEAVDIGPEETAGEVEARLAKLGARMAVAVLDQIAEGAVHGVKQERSLVTRAPKLTKEHGLINWDRAAVQVCNQVRAMQPWPTAYTFLHQQVKPPSRVIMYRARPSSTQQRSDVPAGAILRAADASDSLLIAAGLAESGQRSVVEVLELQPVGKRRMAAEAFLRGHPTRPGDRFGPESP